MFVHQRRYCGVLKTLALHDVTPVTRRIPNRNNQQLVLPLSLLKGLPTPRIPVDRIVRVLKQIRTLLVNEMIGVSMGHIPIRFSFHDGTRYKSEHVYSYTDTERHK